jgi:hypothetical protein
MHARSADGPFMRGSLSSCFYPRKGFAALREYVSGAPRIELSLSGFPTPDKPGGRRLALAPARGSGARLGALLL